MLIDVQLLIAHLDTLERAVGGEAVADEIAGLLGLAERFKLKIVLTGRAVVQLVGIQSKVSRSMVSVVGGSYLRRACRWDR